MSAQDNGIDRFAVELTADLDGLERQGYAFSIDHLAAYAKPFAA